MSLNPKGHAALTARGVIADRRYPVGDANQGDEERVFAELTTFGKAQHDDAVVGRHPLCDMSVDRVFVGRDRWQYRASLSRLRHTLHPVQQVGVLPATK